MPILPGERNVHQCLYLKYQGLEVTIFQKRRKIGLISKGNKNCQLEKFLIIYITCRTMETCINVVMKLSLKIYKIFSHKCFTHTFLGLVSIFPFIGINDINKFQNKVIHSLVGFTYFLLQNLFLV